MEDEGPLLRDEPEPKDLKTAVAVLQAKVYLISRMMVTKHEFTPVKMIAYGIATVVISSVLVAILSYVIRKT